MIRGVDIVVRYSIFGYLLGEGFRNVFKNKKSTIASLVIMCATMFIFGLFFAVGQNVNHITKTIEEQQGMEVFSSLNIESITSSGLSVALSHTPAPLDSKNSAFSSS